MKRVNVGRWSGSRFDSSGDVALCLRMRLPLNPDRFGVEDKLNSAALLVATPHTFQSLYSKARFTLC